MTRKMIRIKYGELKRLISEASDAEEMQPVDGNDSIDSQVDKYLAQYETEAQSSKNEGLDMRWLTKRFLQEAGQDGDEEGDAPDDAAEEPAGPPAPEVPEKLGLDKIDVSSFANSVARLISNADSLLEFRNSIARRAINFVAKTYDDQVVGELKDKLQEEHGIVPGKSKMDVNDEDFAAPRADRAGEGFGTAGGGAP